MKTYNKTKAKEILSNIKAEVSADLDLDSLEGLSLYHARLSGTLEAYLRVSLSDQISKNFYDQYLNVNFNKESILPKH